MPRRSPSRALPASEFKSRHTLGPGPGGRGQGGARGQPGQPGQAPEPPPSHGAPGGAAHPGPPAGRPVPRCRPRRGRHHHDRGRLAAAARGRGGGGVGGPWGRQGAVRAGAGSPSDVAGRAAGPHGPHARGDGVRQAVRGGPAGVLEGLSQHLPPRHWRARAEGGRRLHPVPGQRLLLAGRPGGHGARVRRRARAPEPLRPGPGDVRELQAPARLGPRDDGRPARRHPRPVPGRGDVRSVRPHDGGRTLPALRPERPAGGRVRGPYAAGGALQGPVRALGGGVDGASVLLRAGSPDELRCALDQAGKHRREHHRAAGRAAHRPARSGRPRRLPRDGRRPRRRRRGHGRAVHRLLGRGPERGGPRGARRGGFGAGEQGECLCRPSLHHRTRGD